MSKYLTNRIEHKSKSPSAISDYLLLLYLFNFMLTISTLSADLVSHVESPYPDSHLQNYSSSPFPPFSLLTVKSGDPPTTSTVRPWPSHSFFKSVLASTNNIVGVKNKENQNRSGASVTQSKHGYHHHRSKGFKPPFKTGLRDQSFPASKHEINSKPNVKPPTIKANKENEKEGSNAVSTLLSSSSLKLISPEINVNATQSYLTGGGDKARSSSALGKAIEMPAKTSNKFDLKEQLYVSNSNNNIANATTNSNRKFSQEDQTSLESFPVNPLISRTKVENAVNSTTRLSQYSEAYGPQVGFQYEIVFPIASNSSPNWFSSPRPSPFSSIRTTNNDSTSPISLHKTLQTPSISTSTTSSEVEAVSTKVFHITTSTSSNKNRNNDWKSSSIYTPTDTTVSSLNSSTVNLKGSSAFANDPTRTQVESNTKATSIIINTLTTPRPLSLSTGYEIMNEVKTTKVGVKAEGVGNELAAAIVTKHKVHPETLSSSISFHESNNKSGKNAIHSQQFHLHSPPTQLSQLMPYNSGGEDDERKRNGSHFFSFISSAKNTTNEKNDKIKAVINGLPNSTNAAGAVNNKGTYHYNSSIEISKPSKVQKLNSSNNSNGFGSTSSLDDWNHSHFYLLSTLSPLPTQILKESNTPTGLKFKDASNHDNKFNQTHHHRVETPPEQIIKERKDKRRHNMEEKTALINRKNMFTVIQNKDKNGPSIYIEGSNGTTSPTGLENPPKKNDKDVSIMKDKINQVERPPTRITVQQTGLALDNEAGNKNRIRMPINNGNENTQDYFDEDDAQINLHHWIETEQGHFVTGSTELPMFTNLTWPYYFTEDKGESGSSSSIKLSPSVSNDRDNSSSSALFKDLLDTGNANVATGLSTAASAELMVSLSNSNKTGEGENSDHPQRKKEFNTRYEYYIPSAAADPLQNPILVEKKRKETIHSNNVGSNRTENDPRESWTRVPTLFPASPSISPPQFPPSQKNDKNEKVQQSHWGSKGVSVIQYQQPDIKIKTNKPLYPSHSPAALPPTHFKRKPDQQNNNKQEQHHQTIKVYESSTGSPKSSSTPNPLFLSNYPAFASNLFDVKPEKYSPTFSLKPLQSHLSTMDSIFPIIDRADASTVAAQTETASFVTAKTPTNIFYKPIINHFTATLPINGTSPVGFYENFVNTLNPTKFSYQAPSQTTPMPFSPVVSPEPFPSSTSSSSSSFPLLTGSKVDVSHHGQIGQAAILYSSAESQRAPILFKVWKLHPSGHLTLESQREIPPWALQGYSLPNSGTVLNIQQIPFEFQPIVTDMLLSLEQKTEVEVNRLGFASKPHVWKQLPSVNRQGILSSSTSFINNKSKTKPSQLLLDPSQSEVEESKENWMKGNQQHKITSLNKRPISINYVLWSNPASSVHNHFNHNSQSIILSTLATAPAAAVATTLSPPTPLLPFLLSSQPTPVSYFPSSPITSLSTSFLNKVGTKPISNKSSNSNIGAGFTVIPFIKPSSTPTTISPTVETAALAPIRNREKIDLLFQNYFQYFITTPTPASAAAAAVTTAYATTSQKPATSIKDTAGIANPSDSPAWDDLKRLILRLATDHSSKKTGNKTSFTPEEDQANEYFDHLGTVAAIALIMSYLRNQYDSKVATNNAVVETPTTTTTSLPKPLELPPAYLSEQSLNESIHSLIMQATSAAASTTTLAPLPYGVTDDMTPPHPDQLWATVYPLFQHLLNNPGYKFVPPPSASLANNIVENQLTNPIPFTEPPSPATAVVPVAPGTYYYSNNNPFNHYASYYPTTGQGPTKSPYNVQSVSDIFITEVAPHGATTNKPDSYLVNKLGEVGDVDDPAKSLPLRVLSLIALAKLVKHKKGSKSSHKKKKKLATLAAGALLPSLLRRMMNMAQSHSKYWLDMKWDVNVLDILKKQILVFLAYRYMPVVMVLAFGLIPVTLSLVPLIYKEWWAWNWRRFKKRMNRPKYIKVPYPVPIYKHIVHKPPPKNVGWGHHNNHNQVGQFHHPPDSEEQRPPPPPPFNNGPSGPNGEPGPPPPPFQNYENGGYDQHQHNGHDYHHNNHYGGNYDGPPPPPYNQNDGNPGIIHIDSPPEQQPPPPLPPSGPPPPFTNEHSHNVPLNHHDYFGNEVDSTQNVDETYSPGFKDIRDGVYYKDGDGMVNSFNYKGDERNNNNYYDSRTNNNNNLYNGEHPPPNYSNSYYDNSNFKYRKGANEDNDRQEIHVHLHDDEAQYHPMMMRPTYSPSEMISYTSYNTKDLQPYPATKPWEMGFDMGQWLVNGMASTKQDAEILKILLDTRKERLNKLLEMWKLAKYGVGVASDAAKNVVGGIAGVADKAVSFGRDSDGSSGGAGIGWTTTSNSNLNPFPGKNKNGKGYFNNFNNSPGKGGNQKRRKKWRRRKRRRKDDTNEEGMPLMEEQRMNDTRNWTFDRQNNVTTTLEYSF